MSIELFVGRLKPSFFDVIILIALIKFLFSFIKGIFPLVNIKDKPDSEYRGLLIDLARMWHDVPTLKNIIDLASFYKIKYLQLHLSDDQSFTFPSEIFPKLATPDRPYSKKDFRDLVKYAKDRGIIIIPELDIPGHSRQIVEIYPEIFGVKNKMLQINPWKSNVINIGSEKVYDAIDLFVHLSDRLHGPAPKS